MRRWSNWIFFAAIITIAAAAVYVVWPDDPDRYLPDQLNLPSGNGVPDEVADLMKAAGRNESEQEPCIPLASRRLRVPLARVIP